MLSQISVTHSGHHYIKDESHYLIAPILSNRVRSGENSLESQGVYHFTDKVAALLAPLVS